MTNKEILEKANEITRQYGLIAEIFEGIESVGVGGDERSYTPVMNLTGSFPGNDVLEKISSEISNQLPINRVTFQVAKK